MQAQAPNIDDIIAASHRIEAVVHKTPLLTCKTINQRLHAEIFFKCENLQKAGAFKSRGACNTVFSLPEEQITHGVATHSSGNHAQALARAAELRKTSAYIVMPENAPQVKINAVKGYGGQITFCKPTLEAREATINKIIAQTGAIEIHPYNDYRIIAGQATAAMEIFNEVEDIDIIMAPVGGGGLLSGTALSTKYLSPKTRIIAGEPDMANDAFRSFYEGKFIPSVNPKTIADGLLTSLGTLTYPIIKEHVDDIVTVSEEGIIEAMRLIWERMKIIVEPSSAVPLGCILEGKINPEKKRIAIILSGGNVDLDHLPWLKK
ncbi:MAG: pyridoxal-phosphate dependent enzyme [Bacteroidota bacterium]|nr:pyridoxal-phosphate dependent enzyme [Bacteroidota bacterium]